MVRRLLSDRTVCFFYSGDTLDWYDNEHIPARLTVPGILSVARYKANDSNPPSWIAFVDLTSLDVMQSESYTSLRSNVSVKEASIVSRLATFHRTVYTPFTTLQKPGVTSASFPAPFLLTTAIEPSNAEIEEEQNKWYAEEHLPLLSKVPGFLRARRFKLVDHAELGGKADKNSIKPPAKYLTLYDFDRDTFFDTQEMKDVASSPLAQRMRVLLNPESRLFTLHKGFSKNG
jgi:hypothetical protein